MNIKDNLRYRRTEQHIMEVFSELLTHKDVSQITVRSLCEVAGVNRTTFYSHFQDIYDLMEKMERGMYFYSASIFTRPSEEYDLGTRFADYFAFILAHRDFFKAYLNNSRTGRFLDGLIPSDKMDALQGLTDQLGYQDAHEYIYHQTFFKAGLTALVREWLNTGCKESPEELAGILSREYKGVESRHLFGK